VTRLNFGLDCLSASVRTIRLWTRIPNRVASSVETGNKHWPIVLIAARLIARKYWPLTTLWGHIPEPFTETAVTKLRGTSKELD
jgi:hypothetical protein